MEMTRRVFFDTDFLVNALVLQAPFHQIALDTLIRLEASDGEGWISRQILREFLSALTKEKMPYPPQPKEAIIAASRALERQFFIAEDHSVITEQLYMLVGEVACGGRQMHDANIVATMLAHDIPELLTFNHKDFKRFSGLVDVRSSLA
jgi:predicted nucleic acid-binding protein